MQAGSTSSLHRAGAHWYAVFASVQVRLQLQAARQAYPIPAKAVEVDAGRVRGATRSGSNGVGLDADGAEAAGESSTRKTGLIVLSSRMFRSSVTKPSAEMRTTRDSPARPRRTASGESLPSTRTFACGALGLMWTVSSGATEAFGAALCTCGVFSAGARNKLAATNVVTKAKRATVPPSSAIFRCGLRGVVRAGDRGLDLGGRPGHARTRVALDSRSVLHHAAAADGIERRRYGPSPVPVSRLATRQEMPSPCRTACLAPGSMPASPLLPARVEPWDRLCPSPRLVWCKSR